MTALIIGCGDIGSRVARDYIARNKQVTGVARNSAPLKTSGIPALEFDLDEPPTLNALPTANAELFHFASPPPTGQTDPRTTNLLATMTAAAPRKIVYISTPAVYGDCGGAWIDESQPVAPLSDRGHRRANAERQLQQWCNSHGVPLVILRVPGIYGPGRLPVKRLQSATPMVRREDSPYTNRIHADDLAGIAVLAMSGNSTGIFHASDGCPSKMTDYFDDCAAALGLPAPPKITLAEANSQLSPGLLGYLKESKRLTNNRLQELGVSLLYPSLAAGLPHCVEQYLRTRKIDKNGRG